MHMLSMFEEVFKLTHQKRAEGFTLVARMPMLYG